EGLAGGTSVLPTTKAPTNSKWQPYRLIYELATPITEQAKTIGSLSLVEGDNQIEVTEGRILRERVTPHYYAGLGEYLVVFTTKSTFWSGLKATSKFDSNNVLKIYKNGVEDSTWKLNDISDYNYAKLKPQYFDPTAIYEVDYIPL